MTTQAVEMEMSKKILANVTDKANQCNTNILNLQRQMKTVRNVRQV